MTRPGNKPTHKFSDRREGNRRRDKDAAPKKRNTDPPRGCRPSRLGSRHLLLGGCVLSIFVYTAMPSVPGGDSGELLASGCQFGIPHPPGYPLLNIIYYVTRSTPPWPITPPSGCALSTPSTVAWASNVTSGVFGSATAVLACLTIEEWTRGLAEAFHPGAAAAGALLFSLSPLAWEYSTGSEVFALNNMLVAAALYLTVRIVRHPSLNLARVGALVCGLALSNQHASALVLGPLALSVMWVLAEESLLSWQFVAELGGLWFLLGLSPYATFAMPATFPEQGSWGDLSSIRGFVRHVLRLEYGTLRLGIAAPNSEGALERVREYLMDCSAQTVHVGPPLALLGVGWALLSRRFAGTTKPRLGARRKARIYGIILVMAWVFYVGFWHGVLSNISLQRPMSRAVHARFWMQPNLLVCIAAGGGLGVVANFCAARCWPERLSERLSHAGLVGRFITAAKTLALPLMVMAVLVHLQWDVMNRGAWSGRSHGWTMHLYGQALLSALPKKAILLSHTDLDLNAARYLRVCEGLRADVTHISLQMMPYPWWDAVQAKLHPGVVFPPIQRGVSTRRDSEGNALLITRFLAANIPLGRPIFLDMQAVNENDIGAAGAYRGFTLMPHGLTYRVLPKLTPQGTERWHEKAVRQLGNLEECMRAVTTNTYRPGSWEFAAMSVFWDAHYQAGLFFLSYALGEWVKTPGAEQNPYVLPALRDASSLLHHTLEAVDSSETFSSSRRDLLKNTVLAKLRLLQALQAAALIAADASKKSSMGEISLLLLDRLYAEARAAKEQCLQLIPRFLLEAGDDRDAEAFGRAYIKLREG